MNNSYQGFDASSYLEHYGIKGMKWKVRKAKNILKEELNDAKDYYHQKSLDRAKTSMDYDKVYYTNKDKSNKVGDRVEYNRAREAYEENHLFKRPKDAYNDAKKSVKRTIAIGKIKVQKILSKLK